MSNLFDGLFKGGGTTPTTPPPIAAGIATGGGMGAPVPGASGMPRMPDILSAPNPPSNKGPAVIPTPDPTSPTAIAAARKAAAAALTAPGRLSTVLTRPGPTTSKRPMPTGDYSKPTLSAG